MHDDESSREKKRAYDAAYYVANKARMNAQGAARYAADKDSYKARARKWQAANTEKRTASQRRRRERDPVAASEANRADWLKHNDKRKAAKAAYRKERPDISLHHVRLRQTRKVQATPAWADLDAIKAIYREAAAITKATGTPWHVDHEIPLKHPLVSGLHVPANLRIIPGRLNQSKGNSFTV